MKKFGSQWRAGFPIMLAAFAGTVLAGGPLLFVWRFAQMSDLPPIIEQTIYILWTVVVFLAGPIIFNAVVRTILDLESDP